MISNNYITHLLATAALFTSYKSYQDRAYGEGLCKSPNGEEPSGIVAHKNEAGVFVPSYTHQSVRSYGAATLANLVSSVIFAALLMSIHSNTDLCSKTKEITSGVLVAADILVKLIINKVNTFFQEKAKAAAEAK